MTRAEAPRLHKSKRVTPVSIVRQARGLDFDKVPTLTRSQLRAAFTLDGDFLREHVTGVRTATIPSMPGASLRLRVMRPCCRRDGQAAKTTTLNAIRFLVERCNGSAADARRRKDAASVPANAPNGSGGGAIRRHKVVDPRRCAPVHSALASGDGSEPSC